MDCSVLERIVIVSRWEKYKEGSMIGLVVLGVSSIGVAIFIAYVIWINTKNWTKKR